MNDPSGPEVVPPVPGASGVAIPDDALDSIESLLERALYLDAYEQSRAHGPLGRWTGTRARVIGARLAGHLGAGRLGSCLRILAWRGDRASPEACLAYGRSVAHRRGPLFAWEFLRRTGDPRRPTPGEEAEWLALRASVLGQLRDFGPAWDCLDRADEALSDLPPTHHSRLWVRAERSGVLEAADRYEDALAVALETLKISGLYRPAVQQAAYMHSLLGEDDKAIALLRSVTPRVQSASLWRQLAYQLHVAGDNREAMDALDRAAENLPLMDKQEREGFMAFRSDLAYLNGDVERAVEYGREVDHPFFDAVVPRMSREDLEDRRVLLDVRFVRQHNNTCAPATLTALAWFWGKPADHLEVADTICYDGTSDHSERAWARDNGWEVREFTLSWEASCALLDRGVPFTLATIDADSGHLQAVVGYDNKRGTLLVRDPYFPHLREFMVQRLVERYAVSGPRAMAMVPVEHRDRLDDLHLPDTKIHDRVFRIKDAIESHQREDAGRELDALSAEAGGHRLERQARIAVAFYDHDAAAVLEAAENLLENYEDDQRLALLRLFCLRQLDRLLERLEHLERACRGNEPHPAMLVEYASALTLDAGRHEEAQWAARRAICLRPDSAPALHVLGVLYWNQRRFVEALDLFRFAACMSESNENFANSYFTACRRFHDTDAGLAYLRDRARILGGRSSAPTMTLFMAYLQLARVDEAFDLLESAMAARPEDGDLLLFAARLHAAHARVEVARELLDRAVGKASRSDWFGAAAVVESVAGDSERALEHWREVLRLEPTDEDANANVAQLIAETRGVDAALEHLRDAWKSRPRDLDLVVLYVNWLRDKYPRRALEVLERTAQLHPSNAWTRRELAWFLVSVGEVEAARREALLASRLEPLSPATHNTLGLVLLAAGRLAEGRAALREGIGLDADNTYAIHRLMDSCHTRESRRDALAFVHDQLSEQATRGAGLLAYHMHARANLEPKELLSALRGLHRDRPDLWQAWTVLAGQLIETGDLAEAGEISAGAEERFPHQESVLAARAAVLRESGDAAGEIQRLERALELEPDWSHGARLLADACVRAGDLPRAEAVLDKAISRDPLDASNHDWLALHLWSTDRKEEAFEHLCASSRLFAEDFAVWRRLVDWARELDSAPEALSARHDQESSDGREAEDTRLNGVIERLRELSRRLSGEAWVWVTLARALRDSRDSPGASGERAPLEEAVDAAQRAVSLEPLDVDAHDVRACVLFVAGEREKALAACRPPEFGDNVPVMLRTREAWIVAQGGDIPGAIARLREALEVDPAQFGPWRLLAEWSEAVGDLETESFAIESMIRLAPQDSISWGFLADVRERAGDRKGAMEALRRAATLDPAYLFAACTLADMLLEDGDANGAKKVMAGARPYCPPETALAFQARIGAADGNLDETLDAVRALARTCAEPWPFDNAMPAVLEAGFGPAAYDALQEVSRDADAGPETGRVLVYTAASLDRWGEARDIVLRLQDRGETGQRAWLAYLDRVADHESSRRVAGIVDRHRERLRSSDELWTEALWALLSARRHKDALRWCAGWKERSSLTPRALAAVALACRRCGADRQAGEVSRAAMELPGDEDKEVHAVWLAYDAVLNGEPAKALNLTEGLGAESAPPFYGALILLERALAGVLLADALDEEQERNARHVLELVAEIWPRSRGSLPHARIAMDLARAIARARGTLGARLRSLGACLGISLRRIPARLREG